MNYLFVFHRVLPRVTFIAVPTVMLFYLLVNVSFFSVLSYEQIEGTKAVGLVWLFILHFGSFSNHFKIPCLYVGVW